MPSPRPQPLYRLQSIGNRKSGVPARPAPVAVMARRIGGGIAVADLVLVLHGTTAQPPPNIGQGAPRDDRRLEPETRNGLQLKRETIDDRHQGGVSTADHHQGGVTKDHRH